MCIPYLCSNTNISNLLTSFKYRYLPQPLLVPSSPLIKFASFPSGNTADCIIQSFPPASTFENYAFPAPLKHVFTGAFRRQRPLARKAPENALIICRTSPKLNILPGLISSAKCEKGTKLNEKARREALNPIPLCVWGTTCVCVCGVVLK